MITVIMPCYNQGEYMQEALDSLYAQTLKPEIILVDDGSVDNSKEVIKANKGKIRSITNEKNSGIPFSVNAGIKASKGEYIAVMSQDDKFEPTYLEKCVKALELNPEAGVVTSDIQTFGSKDFIMKPSCDWTADALKVNTVAWGSSVIRKEVYDQLGGWDDKAEHYSDWDMMCRIQKAGWELEYIEEPLFLFRVHGNQASNTVREDLQKYVREKNFN